MDLIKQFNFFYNIQNKLDKNICYEIFKDDHYFKIWERNNYNILNFIDSLDDYNKLILLEWFKNNY